MDQQRELERLRSEQSISKDYEKRLEELKREKEQKGAFDFKGKREVDGKMEEVRQNQEKLFQELREQYDIKVTSQRELDNVISERARQIEKVKIQEEQSEGQAKESLERGLQQAKGNQPQDQVREEPQQETGSERSRETYNKKFLHDLKENNDKLEISMRNKTREQLLAEALPETEIREEDQEEIREEDQEMGLEGMSIGEIGDRETGIEEVEEMEEEKPREMERGHDR